MTLDDLMEIIEIENLDEFEYFEHFSALMECHEEIDYDLFARVLSEPDAEILYELTDNYFEDIMQGVPDDAMSLYTLLYTIRSALVDAARESYKRQERLYYIEELYRFRNWHLFESSVQCRRLSDGLTTEETLFSALSIYRLEKLGEDQYDYDFSGSLDYPIADNYSDRDEPTFNAIEDEDEDDLSDETLIDRYDPVIDGEFEDEEEDDEI